MTRMMFNINFITPKTVATKRKVGPFLKEVDISKVDMYKKRKSGIVMQGAKHKKPNHMAVMIFTQPNT